MVCSASGVRLLRSTPGLSAYTPAAFLGSVGAQAQKSCFSASVASTGNHLGLFSGRIRPLITKVELKASGAAARGSVSMSAVKEAATAVPENVAAAPPADPKLDALRKLMKEADGGRGVDAYIVPTEDPHMSEYPPDCDARRAFISGFTGSAGTVVVTTDKAMLWTDGRYWLQGGQQLGPQWTLMKAGHATVPEIPDWLAENLPSGGRVGIDPYLHTVDAARKLAGALESAGHSLVPLLGSNLVDEVWGEARPPQPKDLLRVHPLEWAGKSVSDKLASLRTEMEAAGAGALLVTMLDEVAWLFNLRGNDVPFNPVFISYGLVTADTAALFVDPSKVPDDASEQLKEAGVAVKPYNAVVAEVQALARMGTKIWIDPSKASFGLCEAAKQAVSAQQQEDKAGSRGKRRRASAGSAEAAAVAVPVDTKALFLERASPVTAAKAIKNDVELAGMVEAHLRDGVALANFWSWLEAEVAAGKVLTECEIDDKLNACRAAQKGFIEPSFPTIAGANGNGAIIHYRPEPETCGKVDGSTLLLLDSGGQYECGTTDITRTVHFGEPTAHQKSCYTRVLQGHIALDTAVFPEGTPGLALDTLARMPLWGMGLNYRHGTGHGVGAALNVHEGPLSISTRYNITVPLQAGMIVSNEPGYYEDGAFGIRIENLVSIGEADTEFRFGGQPYFKFKPLTMCPISTKLMDTKLMSDTEIEWVNSYHKQVWEAISPRVEGDALEWLKRGTQPLARA